MAELDTAAEREAANELIESGEATGQDFADVVPELLDAYDRLRAENQRLKLAALTADRESMELEAKNQRLREAVDEVRDLIKESYGVAGLHQNGDVAEWSELLPGGNFEGWLLNLGELAELPEGDINADTE